MVEETQGYLHSMESMGLVDGPGIRTIFFMQGCPLRCAYCHNPDTQAINKGKAITPSEVLKIAKRYRPYYGQDGGITFSGGEPLLQARFINECAERLQNEGISVTLDSSGYGAWQDVPELFDNLDCILLDVKAFDPAAFQDLTLSPMAPYFRFLEAIRARFQGSLWIRHVMMPGVTDNERSMDRLLQTIEPLVRLVGKIEILPYHRLGLEKYRELGQAYRLEGMPEMNVERAAELEDYARRQFLHRYGRPVDEDHLYRLHREAKLARRKEAHGA